MEFWAWFGPRFPIFFPALLRFLLLGFSLPTCSNPPPDKGKIERGGEVRLSDGLSECSLKDKYSKLP